MSNTWVTTASSNVQSMTNSLIAACDHGFVPEDIHILEMADVAQQVDQAIDDASRTIRAYEGEDPEVHFTAIDEEVDFERIHDHVRSAIEEAKEAGDEVAVDITPGRKFMSAIAFATGMRYDADHVFYLYISSTDYFGRLYPEIPRTATNLYDFTEGY
jgi:hypothetical protein